MSVVVSQVFKYQVSYSVKERHIHDLTRGAAYSQCLMSKQQEELKSLI